MPKKINNISSGAVKKATGKGWDDWIKTFDKEGASEMSHKEIARMLLDKGYIKNGWWAQSVTVGYEYAKGRRVKGQTQTAGFEIGVQKMIPAPPEKVWRLLNSSKAKKIWLGDAKAEIRTLRPKERIRLTWQLKEWDKPSTLQVSLFCPRNTREKTNLRFHQEKLASFKVREQMRKHWRQVLNKISHLSS